jgi:hypothetical protein
LRVAIHQPEYLPWLGYLDKARSVDLFVILDNVQFDRSSLQHRARVIGANGPHWLTIPFRHRFPQTIDEVEFVDDRWRSKHWKSLVANYAKAPGWESAAQRLEGFYGGEFGRPVDATSSSVGLLLGAFGVTTPTRRASALAAVGEKEDLVLSICAELEATTYVSGRTGAEYLDRARFEAHGIELEVRSFTPTPYRRITAIEAESVPGLSAVDAWVHLGDDAPGYLVASS